MFSRLRKSKAFWAGITAIVTTVGAWAMGEIAMWPALSAIGAAVMGIFIRDGVAKIRA